MKNKSLKDILNLQVIKAQPACRHPQGNEDESLHYGVILTTIENQEQYLLHNGYKFGKDQDFVLTSNIGPDWKIFYTYELDIPITIQVLFSAGCCGKNMKYHPQNNNSKHAQERIINKVKECKNLKQNIG